MVFLISHCRTNLWCWEKQSKENRRLEWAVLYWKGRLLISICQLTRPLLLYWQKSYTSEGKDQDGCAYLNEVHVQAWRRWGRSTETKHWIDHPLAKQNREATVMLSETKKSIFSFFVYRWMWRGNRIILLWLKRQQILVFLAGGRWD